MGELCAKCIQNSESLRVPSYMCPFQAARSAIFIRHVSMSIEQIICSALKLVSFTSSLFLVLLIMLCMVQWVDSEGREGRSRLIGGCGGFLVWTETPSFGEYSFFGAI